MIEVECPFCKIHHFLYPNEIETLARYEKVEINCKCGKNILSWMMEGDILQRG